MAWCQYHHHKQGQPHTVVGDLRIHPALWSPQLENHRDLLVWLPPSYQGSHRGYPVLYMMDGQNLFDAHTSYVGEWGVDEAMMALCAEGLEAIIVGIPNMGVERIHEYGPWPTHDDQGGRGDTFLDFVANTVKPLVDGDFRTWPEPEATGIMGSSMGGLISLYAFFQQPTVFGYAGVMSPSLWFAHQGILRTIRRSEWHPGRIYLDMGTQEGQVPRGWRGRLMAFARKDGPIYDLRRARSALQKKGYRVGEQLMYLEDKGGRHNEGDWRRRFPEAFRFFVDGIPRVI